MIKLQASVEEKYNSIIKEVFKKKRAESKKRTTKKKITQT
jgi:hypothetical protein